MYMKHDNESETGNMERIQYVYIWIPIEYGMYVVYEILSMSSLYVYVYIYTCYMKPILGPIYLQRRTCDVVYIMGEQV